MPESVAARTSFEIPPSLVKRNEKLAAMNTMAENSSGKASSEYQ